MRKSCPGFAAKFLLVAILLLLRGSVWARECKDPAGCLIELRGDLRSRKNLARTANDLAEAIANFARAFLTSSEKPANP